MQAWWGSGPLPVVMNPGAGLGAGDAREAVERAFSAAGVEAAVVSAAPEQIEARLRAVVERRLPAVGVAGGDGTLRTAAEALYGSRVVLVPVPTGTLNHFARRHGIGSLEAAARAAAAGRVVEVAVGTVDGRAFLNTATCGLHAEFVRRRDRLRRYAGKWLATGLASVAVAVRAPAFTATLSAGGDERAERLLLLWAGVGPGSFPFPHRADATAGATLLEVVRVPARRGPAGWLALLRMAAAAPAGKVEVEQVSGFRVDAPAPLHATLDGEAMTLLPPLEFAVRLAALRVVAAPEPGS